jgi:glutamine synthetase
MLQGGHMNASQNGYVTDYRPITIKTTDGSTIHGKVNLTSKQRVSDLFTESDTPFLVMIDVVSRDAKGKVMFVNKSHIVWVEPEE